MAKQSQRARVETGVSTGAKGPRYRRIADELLREISSNKLQVGDKLPGEFDLCERYAVSRHTIREALRLLEQQGVIGRHKGIGTVVLAKQTSPAYVQSIHSVAELFQYPDDTTLNVYASKRMVVGQALASRLRVKPGSHWVRIRGVRKQGVSGVPICATDIYVLPRYARVAQAIGKSSKPVFALIEQEFGETVQDVELDIGARALDGDLANRLQVEEQAPAVTVVRRYRGASGKLFEVSVSEHPADRFTYSIALQRGWQTQQIED